MSSEATVTPVPEGGVPISKMPAEEGPVTPFFKLVNSNDLAGAEQMLLTGSASIHDTDSSGMTALMHAAYKGHSQMCRMLLKQVIMIIDHFYSLEKNIYLCYPPSVQLRE